MRHVHAAPRLLADYHLRTGHAHRMTSRWPHLTACRPGQRRTCALSARASSDAWRGARRILKYAGCSEETFILALIYMDQARPRPALPRGSLRHALPAAAPARAVRAWTCPLSTPWPPGGLPAKLGSGGWGWGGVRGGGSKDQLLPGLGPASLPRHRPTANTVARAVGRSSSSTRSSSSARSTYTDYLSPGEMPVGSAVVALACVRNHC